MLAPRPLLLPLLVVGLTLGASLPPGPRSHPGVCPNQLSPNLWVDAQSTCERECIGDQVSRGTTPAGPRWGWGWGAQGILAACPLPLHPGLAHRGGTQQLHYGPNPGPQSSGSPRSAAGFGLLHIRGPQGTPPVCAFMCLKIKSPLLAPRTHLPAPWDQQARKAGGHAGPLPCSPAVALSTLCTPRPGPRFPRFCGETCLVGGMSEDAVRLRETTPVTAP